MPYPGQLTLWGIVQPTLLVHLQLLTRLLKSSHPEDLQAANRLIKSLVKEEQEKSEKVSRRVSAVEEVRSHVKVLQEMLSRYRRPGQAPPDQEALQVLFSNRKEIKEGNHSGEAKCN